MTSSNFLRRATVLLLAASLGCAGDAVAPATRADDVEVATQFALGDSPPSLSHSAQPPQPVSCAPRPAVSGTGTFGPRGGVLQVGQSRLFIPAGALAAPVTITGTALGDGTSTISFQPHGLVFRRPAALVLSGQGCVMPGGATPASVVYVNDAGTVLETIPALYLPRYKLVGAPIRHFSGYAIAF